MGSVELPASRERIAKASLGKPGWGTYRHATAPTSSSGHQNNGITLRINNMLSKVRERFYWSGCREDVESCCKKCSTCARVKEPTKARGPMQQYNVSSPLKGIAVDIAGPFLATKDANKHIMIISHSFSKWPKAYAITNQEATTVARVLVDNWICTFGVPMAMHSNPGRNFESKLFQRVTELLGMRKTRLAPAVRCQMEL